MSGGGWVTMSDVARRAGVSAMTVSRVLQEPARVKAATRDRVEAAIEALGYVRHAGAGALASKESRLVAALVSTLGGSIFTSTIAGLGAELRAAGHELLLGTTDYSPASEEALLEATLGRRPDGLVLSTDRHTARVQALLRRAKAPVVEIWQLPERPLDMAVGFSNRAAGRAITAALLEWGYRRIGFVGALGADDHRGKRRHQGYAEVLAEHRLGPARTVASGAASASIADGAGGLRRLLQRWPDCDAVFCGSDPIAFGAISEAARAGLRVPEDLAVVGFGDFDFAGAAGLGLTTVRIPGERIGREAARLILAAKAGAAPASTVINVGFEIVRRRSA